MYFFIGANLNRTLLQLDNWSKAVFCAVWPLIFPRKVFGERWLERRFVLEPVRFRDRLAGKSSIAGVDASNERGLFFARAVESEISQ